MKTIYFDARHIHSGIGSYTLGILDSLHRMNLPFNVAVIGDRRLHEERYPRFQIIHDSTPIYTLREQKRIALLSRDADLLHVPHFNIPLGYRGKLVTTIHDTGHFVIPELQRQVLKRLYTRLFYRAAVRRSSLVLTVSNFSRNQIMTYTGCPEENIRVVYNGVAPIFDTAVSAETRSKALMELGIETPYLLYVGNFKPHKNLVRTIAAFRRAREAYRLPHQLVLVGHFDRSLAPAALTNHPRVIVKTDITINKLVSLYQGAEALLLFSLYEGFGLTPVEAMRSGTPVIVSDIPPLREVVGTAGIFADPTDVPAMAEAIGRLTTDSTLRQSLVEKGSRRSRKFTWEKAARQVVEVYTQVLKI